MDELYELKDPELAKRLLLQAGLNDQLPAQMKPPCITVLPKPGFCLKTKDQAGKKVFINVCHSDNLPVPRSITDEELLKLLEADDSSGFRIPMSLGEPHAELDHLGQGCTAYDVVVSPDFLNQLQKRQILLGFFLTIVLEGIEYKYDLTLDRNWKMLKNKKCIGSLPEQNVRSQSKPWIQEMGGSDFGDSSERKSSSKTSSKDVSKIPEPTYTLVKDKADGQPDYLVLEVHLPKLASANTFTVDLSEDWLLLETRAGVYRLDKGLPYTVRPDDSGAEFDVKSRILSITMPVVH